MTRDSFLLKSAVRIYTIYLKIQQSHVNGAFHGMAHVNSFSPQQVCFKYGLPWDCVSRAVRTFQQYFLPYFSYNLPYAAQEVNSPSPPSFLPGRKALLELLLFDTFLRDLI